jgi:hypothetical protein
MTMNPDMPMTRIDKTPVRCGRPVQLTTPYVDDRIRNNKDDRD